VNFELLDDAVSGARALRVVRQKRSGELVEYAIYFGSCFLSS